MAGGRKPSFLILFVLAKIPFSGRMNYGFSSVIIFLARQVARKIFENFLNGTRSQKKIGILKGVISWFK
jgi:hypothetical protein